MKCDKFGSHFFKSILLLGTNVPNDKCLSFKHDRAKAPAVGYLLPYNKIFSVGTNNTNVEHLSLADLEIYEPITEKPHMSNFCANFTKVKP